MDGSDWRNATLQRDIFPLSRKCDIWARKEPMRYDINPEAIRLLNKHEKVIRNYIKRKHPKEYENFVKRKEK